jgi:catechol 2,3-dioxygenase-like lactoylglutathione lyase family enzyme
MLAHVSIQCAAFEASAAFYDAVLAPLGGERIMQDGETAIGYGLPPAATFWIGRQQTGDGFRETRIGHRRRDPPRAQTLARIRPDLLRRLREGS